MTIIDQTFDRIGVYATNDVFPGRMVNGSVRVAPLGKAIIADPLGRRKAS